ncbi:MAG: endonuclease/exonuclease/phosphatase family protein, partial [Verrucomicrobiota bacterium]|nr:endonuclease/exonuclease/phosphatase family protein [Verrucomicrobiota bacterium]
MSIKKIIWMLLLCLACGGGPAVAVPVRIATFNVLHGLDTNQDRATAGEDDDYAAVLGILNRVQPDIVAFQELYARDLPDLISLAATLDYPYYAMISGPGSAMMTSTHKLGILSRFPIDSSVEVEETFADPLAAEFTRRPLHAKILVPGALNPLHVLAVHTRSGTTEKAKRLWRGIEAYRIQQYIDRLLEADPLDTEYILLGD